MQLTKYLVLAFLLLLSGLPAHAWVHGVAAAGCNYSSQGGDCGPGVYNILNNGGVADGQDVSVTTTISSGSASLVVGTAIFAATDCQSGAGCTGAANKAIGVWGAGSAGAILSTTITGFTSSTHVTLAANAGTALSAQSEEIRWGTDNSAAIQTLVNTLGNGSYGGTIYFPSGMYMVNGAFQSSPNAAGESIILLPQRLIAAPLLNINFVGQMPPTYGSFSVIGSQAPPLGGSIIMTTVGAASGNPSILGGSASSGIGFTYIGLGVGNLTFRAYNNPAITAIDANWIDGLEVDNVLTDTGQDPLALTPQSNTASYGLKTPLVNNGAFTRVTNFQAIGYSNGLQINEHFSGDNISIYFCKVGAVVNGGNYHSMNIGRLLVQHTQYALRYAAGGPQAMNIADFDVEWVNGGTWGQIYDIDDGNNEGTGLINWHLVEANVGNTHSLLISGGALLRLQEINATRTYTVSTLPACNSATEAELTTVTDATSPTYNATLSGSGTVIVPAFCNGTNWVAH